MERSAEASPTRRRLLAAVALVLASVIVPASATGQLLRGSVVYPDSASPASGILVEARPVSGTAQRTLTNSRGFFSIALDRADSVIVRVLRIGYGPTVTQPMFVAAGDSVDLRIVLENLPFHLAGVTVKGSSRCGRRANAEGWLLWEQALTLLRSVDLTVRDPAMRIRTVEYQGPTTEEGITRVYHDSLLRLVPALGTQPDVYYDSLFERGFVRRNTVPGNVVRVDRSRRGGDARGLPVPDTTVVYYGPDARVLADERFGPAYCFRTQAAADTVPGFVAVAFTPVARRRTADIEGTLWFDATSHELKRIDFDYVQLPSGHNVRGAGGYVEFAKLPNGQWIASGWMIRMAQRIITRNPCYQDYRGLPVWDPKGVIKACARIVEDANGLWARSQLVASVTRDGERLYFDEYAESLALRGEAARARK
jgi:hypothetical protein